MVANDIEENMWAIEYILRKEMHMTTEDINSALFTKILYFLDRMKKENDAMQEQYDSISSKMH